MKILFLFWKIVHAVFKELVLIIELVAKQKQKPISICSSFTSMGWMFGHMGLWGSLGSGIGSEFKGQHLKMFIFIGDLVLVWNC